MGAPKLTASINGTTYNIRQWQSVQQGQVLKEEWRDGFLGGMGEYLRRSRDRYYHARNMDTSLHPLLRLRPEFDASIAVANLDTTTGPFYAFATKSAGGTSFAYILNGRYMQKIDIAADAVEVEKDFGANTDLGRPALFEGKWYIPLGATNNAQELTTVANDGAGADTFSSLGVTALDFAAGQSEGTAQLARASTPNIVDLTSDISSTPAAGDWSGDDFEVGDTSLPIVDMHWWNTEYAVVKNDSVWLFDALGNSNSIQQFTARTDKPRRTMDGANSMAVGPYFYWPSAAGLYRFFGQRGAPVGYDASPDWFKGFQLDGLAMEATGALFEQVWTTVAAYGRWLYATRGSFLYAGYINDDGTLRWHGALHYGGATTTRLKVAVTEDGTYGPILWLAINGTLNKIGLGIDGGLQRGMQTSRRGAASEAFQFWLQQLDFGLPDREKQLRRMWCTVTDWDAEASLQLAAHLNRATASTNVGSAYTTAGNATFEKAWTPGTNDLAYEVMPTIKITTSSGYASSTSDPQIRAFGIEAATASVYAAVIPLTVEEIADGQTRATEHQKLRDLLNGPRVAIIEPTQHGAGDTFNGRIIGYSEEAVPSDRKEGEGWIVTLRIERFDYGS